MDPNGLKMADAFIPKYDLRFCPLAAATNTDAAFCRDIVYECTYNGTLGNICKFGSMSACQEACVASQYYEGLKKFCKFKLNKPKVKK